MGVETEREKGCFPKAALFFDSLKAGCLCPVRYPVSGDGGEGDHSLSLRPGRRAGGATGTLM